MQSAPTTADLVDHLFKTHLKEDGREYSYQEVSKGTGGELEASYIAKVRRGVIKNPGRDALKYLCVFFKVPADYFFPDLTPLTSPDKIQDQFKVVLRSMGLSP